MGDGGGDEREILRVEAQRTLFISHSPALLSLSRWCQLVRVLLDLQVSTPLGWRGGGGGDRNGGNGRKADFLFLPFVAPLNGERRKRGSSRHPRPLFGFFLTLPERASEGGRGRRSLRRRRGRRGRG